MLMVYFLQQTNGLVTARSLKAYKIIDDMLKLGKDSVVFDDFYVMFDSNQIEILDIL